MECSIVRDEMMDVLYGEAGEVATKRVEDHLRSCAACREEMAGFSRVRRDLRAWKVPAPGRRAFPPLLAAAAVLALMVGGALAFLEARGDAPRFGFKFGGDADIRERVSSLEKRLASREGEIEALRASLASRDDEALLRRVRGMLDEEDARQGERLHASLAELGERTETQRRYDLARVSAGLSYLDGKTGQDMARTTELVGYVLQASQKK
jgi:hypothetical protein